ncbi:5-formyltetrahydrofolate cyclo-ligase [Sphaerochaeta halotolerans]|jgi:5-formyltetrahydrofolate cyclo-ligase|uniref:5-formyltetrahydrofolate cyclo-ligase n=1 Tax=Sphaerochaeta halotolerans TaxID=2293840 RepID=A0A372MJI9_9SPIR|nr:5-formyltetrahydrofolate cyclo-ligase [Sphaerochaeta halotolerans]RFU95904.1 5-formyltetrahydrofolate cyclo-ligase [Sphaerochaeta halotolerans]
MQSKESLRTQLITQEKVLRGTDFSREDLASCNALLSSTLYTDADWVFAYYPITSEVDIKAVLHDAIAHKHLALPVSEMDGTMTFREVTRLDQLHRGSLGITEPREGNTVVPTARTLILVPGVAFSMQKDRIGRGKGYYDRYLQKHREAFTLGICRSHQIIKKIPTDQWDIQVNALLCGGAFF